MKKINAYQAAAVFSRYAREIVKAARSAPRGWRVLAEVDGDGGWLGAGAVPPGTGSLLAHQGRGYALYVSGGRWRALVDVEDAIERWLEEMALRAEAQAEARKYWW